jgi:hypothetical protein
MNTFVSALGRRKRSLSFIHKYLSDVHYMPNTELGACDKAINKGDSCNVPPP